jgi:hypothetical protein
MDWLSFTIASSRRANGLVFRVVQIEDGKLRLPVLNIGIGIIVPASVKTTDLALNLEYSPDVAARVFEAGCWSEFRSMQEFRSLPAALSLRGRLPTYFSAKSPSCSARVVSRYCCLSYSAMQSSTGRLEARIITTIISCYQGIEGSPLSLWNLLISSAQE